MHKNLFKRAIGGVDHNIMLGSDIISSKARCAMISTFSLRWWKNWKIANVSQVELYHFMNG